MPKHCFALLALLLIFTGSPARAQFSDRVTEHPTLSQSSATDAVAMTRAMANRLHLNEGQVLKLTPLNRTKLIGLKSIAREYKNDPATRAAKTAELEAQYEQECSRILTPSQLSQLQQQNDPLPTAPGSTGNGLG